MAQLRLQDEVNRLEGSLTTGADDTSSTRPGSAVLPPYVVPDGPSLCDHLTVIKQLAASSRFIVIIPINGLLTHFGYSFSFWQDFLIGTTPV